MGIFDAMTTAVTGLQAQSFALQNISGNIANSQTTGFKETNTSFQDLVTAASPNAQTSGSVLASSVATNSVQGAIQSASVSTYMAINGDGYFIVARPTSVSGNQPVFNGVTLYTRRGDFQENSQGFLVNGAGYYLMGIPIDRSTGNPVGSVPEVLQFGNNEIPAQVTTQIQYQANLPTFPQTTNANASIPGSELINPADFTSNPLLLPATIRGVGATLLPDAPAVETGSTNIGGLPTGGNNGTLDINGTPISIANSDSATTILQKINAQTSTTGVSATLNASNNLVLTTKDAVTNISTAGSTPAILTERGLGSGANAIISGEPGLRLGSDCRGRQILPGVYPPLTMRRRGSRGDSGRGPGTNAMRVYGLNRTGAAVVSTPVRRAASDSFSVGNETAPRAATGAGAPRLISDIDALLAVQGFDDPLERRRRAVKRGRTALDALKLGLLTGTLESGTLAALKSVAAELADRTGEPQLDTVLAEIELRVGVELAKIGMPQRDESSG